jgi:hypothetical protein
VRDGSRGFNLRIRYTQVKIFTASDKEKQRLGFCEYIAADVLPECWGGARPDSECLPVAGLLLDDAAHSTKG